MSKRDIVWSYGGGVQTTAILVLVAKGILEKPTRVVMSNTSRERSLVWKYIVNYTLPLMDSLGMSLEIVPHSYSAVDLYSLKGELLLPAFTQTGKLNTFCSTEWKLRAVRRYLREIGYGPNNKITQWLGMSLDEVHRMRTSDVNWIDLHYPLIFDVRKRRHECLLLIKDFGLPKPPKSACYMCPFLDDDEWIEERDETPEDFEKAIELYQEIRDNDIAKGRTGVYIHRGLQPLNETTFVPSKQTPMEQVCGDTCWT